MKQQGGKILYLDGVRGVASLNVLLTHYVVAFYPAMFSAEVSQAHFAGGIEVKLAKSLATIFYAGNLAVPLLFVLSAYVLSFQFFKYQDSAIATASAYRRYMRLEIPVLFSVLFSWLLFHFGLYFNHVAAPLTHSEWFLGSYFQFEPSFLGAVKQALWECFAAGGSVSYNPVLWTMNYEMLGSFTVFGFLALFGKSERRYIIYVVMLLVFIKSFYLAFIFGMILSDMSYSAWGERIRTYLRRNNCLTMGIIVLGLLIGSYFDDNRNAWCAAMNSKALRDWGIDLWAFYHVVGATLVLFGVLHNSWVQKLLDSRLVQFLGRLSFAMYLLHFILICSFGSYLFVKLIGYGLAYNVSVAITAAATTVVIFILSYIMTKYVDEPAMKWTRKLQKKYLY